MNDHVFEHLKGTKLHRYLENNDIFNLYASLKETIDNIKLSPEIDCPYPSLFTSGMSGEMKLQFTIRNECLSVFYSFIYDQKLSFMVGEIIDTVIENEDPMDNEYIIMFFSAVKYNDYDSIDMILSNGFDMNMIGEERQYITNYNIMTTAYRISKNESMVRYLLSNGGDINNENCYIGWVSCSRGDVGLVDYLLDLDISDDKLLSMFIASIKKKNFTIADKIIGHGFKIEDKYEEILNNWQAFANASLKTIKYLILRGLDINKYSSRLLRFACRQNNSKLVDFYLENNLTLDQEILDVAFGNSELDIIDALAKHFVDLSVVKFKETRYDSLIESLKNNDLDMMAFLKYLLKRVEDGNKRYYRISQ